MLDAVRTYLGSPLGPMRGRDGNVHRGRPKEGLLRHDQPSGRDDFRGQRRAAGPPVQGHHRHRGRGLHRRWRHFHRRLSRGAEPGGGGETAAGAGRGQQPIRLFHAQRPPVRLPRPGGQGRRATASTATRWTAPIWRACLQVRAARRSSAPAQGAGRSWSWPSCCGLCGHGEHDDASYIDPKLEDARRWAGIV